MKILAVALSFIILTLISIAHGETKQTTNASVYLHTGPNAYSEVVTQISAKTSLDILGENTTSGFVFVRTSDGKTGWIAKDYIQPDEVKPNAKSNHTLLDKIYDLSQKTWTTTTMFITMTYSLAQQLEAFHLFCLIGGAMVLSCGILIGLLLSRKQTYHYRLRWQ